MIRILIIVALLLALLMLLRRYTTWDAAAKKKFWAWFLFTLFFAGIVLLTISGRLHVIAAIVAGAIPFMKRLLPFIRYIPVLRRFYRERKLKQGGSSGSQQSGTPSKSGSPMSAADAYAVLGLTAGASRQDIIDAHRSLMQKLHPDRGGNDFLAAQLNQAKDVLLKELD